MKLRIPPIVLFLLILALFQVAGAGAEENRTGVQSAPATLLVQLINDARAHPLDTAESFGFDRDEVLNSLPQLAQILTEGLPPLEADAKLSRAAGGHATEMLTGGFFSKESPDGRGVADRIRDAGYGVAAAGESLGGLVFFNFLDSNVAVHRIFESMFRAELDPRQEKPRNIFSPDFSALGVGISTGRMLYKGTTYSVYLATVDFAVPAPEREALNTVEQEVLQLINQARAKPLEAAAVLGIDLEAVSTQLPDLYDLMTLGLPPLTLNGTLMTAARNHAEAVLAGMVSGDGSSGEQGAEDRAYLAGYTGDLVGETTAQIPAADFPNTDSAAQALFEQMFREEMDPAFEGARLIMSPDAEDVGIGVIFGWGTDGGAGAPSFVAALEAGTGGGDRIPSVTGVVYKDVNGNGLYNAGEGVANQPVIVYGAGLHLRSATNGGIKAQVAPGGYWVILFSQEEPLEIQEVNVTRKNSWVSFQIEEYRADRGTNPLTFVL